MVVFLFDRDNGTDVQDSRSGSSIQSIFASCLDLQNCGLLDYVKGNASANFNYAANCAQGLSPLLQLSYGFLKRTANLLGGTPLAVFEPLQGAAGAEFLPIGLRQYLASAARDPDSPVFGEPTLIGPGNWILANRSWRLTQDVNGLQFIRTVTTPRRSPVLDNCGQLIGQRASATYQISVQDQFCVPVLINSYTATVAVSNAFTSVPQVTDAINTVAGATGAGFGNLSPDGTSAAVPCALLPLLMNTSWRENVLPGLMVPGTGVTINFGAPAPAPAG